MLPPGCSLSPATSSATSPSISVEFCHPTLRSVLDATYFAVVFRWCANGSSLGAVGHYAAMPS